MPRMARWGRLGMIARWKPVHLGHAAVLRAMCRAADAVVVGVGSANRYDARNPFTPGETEEMIRLALPGAKNYTLLRVPDLGDGPRWRELAAGLLGPLDLYLTDNGYVRQLMAQHYEVRRPVELLAPGERVPLSGTQVREAMARGPGWRGMVPPSVARYIEQNGLDARFRREFGLQTLAHAVQG